MNPKLKILKRNLLKKNFIFIDGMSKTGKTVICMIIKTLNNCQNYVPKWRYNNILKFNNLNLIDEDLAIDLILQDMQISMIEDKLSRYVNFREHDSSSVNNSVHKEKYLNNLKIKDNDYEIDKIIKNLKKNRNIIPIMLDDFFPNCKGKFNFFLNFKKIITLRNPIGVMYSNLSRNKIDKIIKGHPWQIGFHYLKNNKKIPWFIKPKEVETFFESDLVDKYMMFMNTDYKPYLNQKLYNIKKTQFFFIEDVWSNPAKTVKKITKFLGTSKTINTDLMLKNLKLPRINLEEKYEKEYYFLKDKMSSLQFKKILQMEKNYNFKKNRYGF